MIVKTGKTHPSRKYKKQVSSLVWHEVFLQTEQKKSMERTREGCTVSWR